jgi:hypothetical protein
MVWKPRILSDGTRQHAQLADVEDWVLSAARTYRAPLYLDLSLAASMEQSLIRQGVFAEAKEPTVSFNSKVAVTLYRLLADRAMSLPNDEDLADELRPAGQRAAAEASRCRGVGSVPCAKTRVQRGVVSLRCGLHAIMASSVVRSHRVRSHP